MNKRLKRLLSLVMALAVIAAMAPVTARAADCNHESYSRVDFVDSTCTEEGYEEYECDDCGETWQESLELADCYDEFWDGDHLCDECGEPVDDYICYDDDSDMDHDHLCEDCGEFVEDEKCDDDTWDGDHLCDECGAVCSECDDYIGDGDHLCDDCEVQVSECEDIDVDGWCDDCGEQMGECAHDDYEVTETVDPTCTEDGYEVCVCNDCEYTWHDAIEAPGHYDSGYDDNDGDGDHLCDDCGEPYGECWSETNHFCDDCGERMSECEDNDGDGWCDVCGEQLGECTHSRYQMVKTVDPTCSEAGYEEYVCDDCEHTWKEYLGDATGCYDDDDEDDHDHNCEECGKFVAGETCYDAVQDGDHNCDECHEPMEGAQCDDNAQDGDHNCDECKEPMEDAQCADHAQDGDHNCDDCDEPMEDAACTDTDDHNCDDCGEPMEGAECADNDGDNACDICGTVLHIVIPRAGSTLSYKSMIYVIDIFDLSGLDLEGVDLSKDAGLLVLTEAQYAKLDGAVTYDKAYARPGLTARADGTYYGKSAVYNTMDLYLNYYFIGYVKLANGSYVYSEPQLYGPSIYAETMRTAGETEQTRSLCVAMLNYISAIQTYKGISADKLVNASLTAEEKTLSWTDVELNLAPAVDESKQVEKDTAVFKATGKNLQLSQTVYISALYKLDTTVMKNASEAGTIFWTAKQFAALEGAPSLDNYGKGTKAAMKKYQNSADMWVSNSPAIGPRNMADTVYYYMGYVVDSSGDVHYSGVMSYTVEQYINNKAGKGDALGELCKALYYYERAVQAVYQ